MASSEESSADTTEVAPGDALQRRLLTRALRAKGFGSLCKAEPIDQTVLATRFSQGLLSAVLVGFLLFGIARFDLTLWQALGAMVILLIAVAIVGLRTGALFAIYLSLLLAWIALGIVQLFEYGLDAFALTHLLPFAIVAGAVSAWRALQLVLAIPLVLPVVFLIIATPLLSADPWEVADAARGQLAWFGGVAIAPLLALVIARHLKASVLSVFRAAADRIRRAGEAEERTLEILKKLRSDDDGSLDEDHIRASASMALGEDPADDDLEAIATVVSRSFRRRSALRVCRLAAGVFILVTLLTYILAWAAVPLKVAAKWVGHAIPVEHVRLVGFDAALPVGAYIGIALLLAIVATAGFLAFALTEDRYSEALSDAVTHRPAEEGLLLALPYHAITDQSTSASRQRGHGGDESRGRRAA